MRNPDRTSADGSVRVWRLNTEHMPRVSPATDGTLAAWLVEGPFHPLWDQWLVSVMHLRDIEGAPKANLQMEGATHELMMVSINPENRCDVDVFERTGGWGDAEDARFLTPIDQSIQWTGGTDDEALQVAESAINAILSGAASPDQDWRGWWSTAVANTLDHLRRGPGAHWPQMEGKA